MPSKLAKQCRECIFKVTCDNKRLEAYGYLQPTMQNNMEEMVQPLIRKTDPRDIKVDTYTTVTIDLEEIKEQLKLRPFVNDGIFKNGRSGRE